MNPIIVIPARMASTRLPNKPLADIGGLPMIVRVWKRAMESGLGEVIVACDGQAIAGAITKAGGRAVITDPGLPSGSDRIWQALEIADPQKKHDVVINLQGDMPTLDARIIGTGLKLLENKAVNIGTLAAIITDPHEKSDPAVVKAIIELEKNGRQGRALNFTRAAATGAGPHYHHIGIYFYRRASLEKFVSLPPSPLEQKEKLEQLRAQEAGMRIDAAIVDTVPLGVDTPETLEKARKLIGNQ
jgi:3-deoxy-manno-octulosonate cytidylyltransferase (CMP-KDO synthetase)